MSLSFALTQLYRLAVDDLVIMYDAYYFYGKLKPEGRSYSEFGEILGNLIDVESHNFEDIDETRLSHGDEGRLSYIAWDYLVNVMFRYLLDDLSQYPFWRAKIAVATRNERLGSNVVKLYFQELKEMATKRSLQNVLNGCVPYLVASFIENFPYLVKNTKNFLQAIWSKIPRPPSIEDELARPDLNSLSNMASSHKVVKVKTVTKKKQKPWYESTMSTLAVTALSHPFLVIAAEMITKPIYFGRSWLYAYYRILADRGPQAFYRGLRTRALFAVIPVSSFAFCGIVDSIVYRRMLGQGSFDTTGGILSVLKEIKQENQSALTLLNYGLVTAVHAIPGFFSFLGFRLITGLLFGSSIHRKDQIARRKEIVDAHLNKIKKKSSSSKVSIST